MDAGRLTAVRLETLTGGTTSPAALRGSPVILVYAGRHGAEAAMAVGRSLRERLADMPQTRIIPVVCLGEIPGFLRGFARSQVRQAAAGVETLIDFERGLERALGMRADVANVAVLDATGRVAGVVAGAGDACVAAVEKVMRGLA